jgi:hypothetical protein
MPPENFFLEESVSTSVSQRNIFSGNGEDGQNDDREREQQGIEIIGQR